MISALSCPAQVRSATPASMLTGPDSPGSDQWLEHAQCHQLTPPSSGLPGWHARRRGPGEGRGRPEARAPFRLPKLGMKQSRPVRNNRRATAPSTGMTSRSPPPSASALRCASASTLSPAKSQDRVRVISTTTVACRCPSASRRAIRSCSAVVASISGDADTTATPLIKGYLLPDSCAHLPCRKRDLAQGTGGSADIRAGSPDHRVGCLDNRDTDFTACDRNRLIREQALRAEADQPCR
jgi:hypothetical protein